MFMDGPSECALDSGDVPQRVSLLRDFDSRVHGNPPCATKIEEMAVQCVASSPGLSGQARRHVMHLILAIAYGVTPERSLSRARAAQLLHAAANAHVAAVCDESQCASMHSHR